MKLRKSVRLTLNRETLAQMELNHARIAAGVAPLTGAPQNPPCSTTSCAHNCFHAC